MNILVIGNGFDLAHGLPTRYTDFLEWVDEVYYKQRRIEKGKISVNVMGAVTHGITSEELFLDMLNNLRNNIWVEYFIHKQKQVGDNWIDFENEISKVIQQLELNMCGNSTKDIRNMQNDFIKNRLIDIYFPKKSKRTSKVKQTLTYQQVIDTLRINLLKLIRALEIYLSVVIRRIEIRNTSLDIQGINPDKVLSFNYTDTYEKEYGANRNIDYDYVHGKANKNNDVLSNNIVLGIAEYLSEEKRNTDIDFIEFKKFYQRIYKQTGCKYKEWIDEIRESGIEIEKKLKREFPSQIPFDKFKIKHYLYIFGHSLDVSDKDILRDIIMNDNVYTTIYYYKRGHDNGRIDLENKVANLVKVIGQDELIRRTGGRTKTIEFKLQQDMVPVEK